MQSVMHSVTFFQFEKITSFFLSHLRGNISRIGKPGMSLSTFKIKLFYMIKTLDVMNLNLDINLVLVVIKLLVKSDKNSLWTLHSKYTDE